MRTVLDMGSVLGGWTCLRESQMRLPLAARSRLPGGRRGSVSRGTERESAVRTGKTSADIGH